LIVSFKLFKNYYIYIYIRMVSCYYTIKSNPERLEREKQRVKNFLNNKYLNDEAYREKCKEYSRLYRLKKKLEQEEKENDINK